MGHAAWNMYHYTVAMVMEEWKCFFSVFHNFSVHKVIRIQVRKQIWNENNIKCFIYFVLIIIRAIRAQISWYRTYYFYMIVPSIVPLYNVDYKIVIQVQVIRLRNAAVISKLP